MVIHLKTFQFIFIKITDKTNDKSFLRDNYFVRLKRHPDIDLNYRLKKLKI